MSLKTLKNGPPPLAKNVNVVGDYINVIYDDGELARMHKSSFVAPLCAPNFLNVEIIDEGQTLKMGDYEACTDYLYELYVEDGLED